MDCNGQTRALDHGLKPIGPPTVQGFESVDEFSRHIVEQLAPAEEHAPDDDYSDSEDPDDWIGGDVACH